MALVLHDAAAMIVGPSRSVEISAVSRPATVSVDLDPVSIPDAVDLSGTVESLSATASMSLDTRGGEGIATPAMFMHSTSALVVYAGVSSPTLGDFPSELQPGVLVTLTGQHLDRATVSIEGSDQTTLAQTTDTIWFYPDLSQVPYKQGATLRVYNKYGEATASVDLVPPNGYSYVVASGDIVPNGQRTLFPDGIEAGHQCEYQSTTGEGASVTVFADGTFKIEGTGSHSFYARLYDGSKWARHQTVTVNYEDRIGGYAQSGPASTEGSLRGSVTHLALNADISAVSTASAIASDYESEGLSVSGESNTHATALVVIGAGAGLLSVGSSILVTTRAWSQDVQVAEGSYVAGWTPSARAATWTVR